MYFLVEKVTLKNTPFLDASFFSAASKNALLKIKVPFLGEKVPSCLEIRRNMSFVLGENVFVLPLTNDFYTRKYLFVSETEEKCLFWTIKYPFRRFKKCPFFKITVTFLGEKVPFCLENERKVPFLGEKYPF